MNQRRKRMKKDTDQGEAKPLTAVEMQRGVMCADYDFKMPSTFFDKSPCYKEKRPHRMKRINKYVTKCIYAGCNKLV
jgi:hypothetical protein